MNSLRAGWTSRRRCTAPTLTIVAPCAEAGTGAEGAPASDVWNDYTEAAQAEAAALRAQGFQVMLVG
jgi:hypothetical protein